MRPGSDLGLAPAEQNVRMVTLLFGNRAHTVDKSQRRLEIRKLVTSYNVVLVNHIPMGELRQLVINSGQFRPLQRRNAAAAGNAGFIGERGHRKNPQW